MSRLPGCPGTVSSGCVIAKRGTSVLMESSTSTVTWNAFSIQRRGCYQQGRTSLLSKKTVGSQGAST
eukprot:10922343-Karenia_brevis.AAC.1